MLLSFPPFSTKTHAPLFFPSPNLSSQTNKPLRLTIHSSSSIPPNPQTVTNTAIKRIAEKLRSLGYVEDQKNLNQTQTPQTSITSPGEIFLPFPNQLPNKHVGYTVDSSWSTPQNPVPEPGSGVAISRFHELNKAVEKEKKLAKRVPKVPTLAELKVSDEELRRLRTVGVGLKKKLNVGKAGVTEGIVNGIHERWRRSEVVKIKCEDLCRLNMKRTHDILERKTGGLVIWRSGGTIILYRGDNYKYPYFLSNNEEHDHGESSTESGMNDGEHNYSAGTNGVKFGSPNHFNKVSRPSLVHGVGSPNRVRFQLPGEAQLSEEADCLLDGLGPRFTDWWGYEPLPVDADLLPAIVPGYRRPFRLLPYGIKPKLTDDEMTTLRRLSRPLPCHFALGRNRRHQGLAVSMVKLWEKCEIAKIAVKRGVQNTNSDMMAEELKWLTGGTLLSRDREFIVFYRGKDFLPAAVSTAIEERRKNVVHKEKQLKGETPSTELIPQTDMKTGIVFDDRLQETIQKNMEIVAEQRKVKSATSRIKRINTKLSMALEKKEKAEKLLLDLETTTEPQKAEIDKEGITEEERYMLKKVGLRMKAYLPLGRRGIFDGTVENMHLHWKYRELVKILASERSIEDVHAAARTLEAESGGILVAVERVNREFAIIVYRGKNYQRPVDLRPRTLLNKKQALKRSIEAQRRESLKLHVLKLTKNIDELKHQLVNDNTAMNNSQQKEISKLKVRDSSDSLKNFHSENDASSMELTNNQKNLKSEKCMLDAADATPLQTDSCVDDLSYNKESIQLHKLMDTTSKYVGPAETEVRSTSEPNFGGEHSGAAWSENLKSEKCMLDAADATPLQTDSCVYDLSYDKESIQLHKLMDTTSKYVGPAETEVRSTSEPNFGGKHSGAAWSEVGDRDDSNCTSSTVKSPSEDGMARSPHNYAEASSAELIESSRELEKGDFNPSDHKDVGKTSSIAVSFKSAPLPNRDRLLLRKQALKMQKRPVLSIGRNNIITGVAKTIKTHFQKYPLAIVNIKNRAEGTSVQEVIYMLEQATGAVLVSQETNKVILYRGWGMEEGKKGKVTNKKNTKTIIKERRIQDVVSPQLMEAIRLECGLQVNRQGQTL